MPRLRKQITGYLIKVAAVVLAVMLGLFVFLQIRSEQERLSRDAEQMFYQIGQILDENRAELESLRAEYSETTLHRAETIAEILGDRYDAMWDIDELSRVAHME